MNLCACGCGEQTRIASDTYAKGHFLKDCPSCDFTAKSSRSMGIHLRRAHVAPKQHEHLCECGCGKRTEIESDSFITGHWNASLKMNQHGTVMCYRLTHCRCELCCKVKLNANRSKALHDRYGLTIDDLHGIIQTQGNRCMICERTLAPYGMKPGREQGGGGETHIDHDHATGKFRGVLCRSCNQGLGKFRDDPSVLLRASLYVRSCGSMSTEERK